MRLPCSPQNPSGSARDRSYSRKYSASLSLPRSWCAEIGITLRLDIAVFLPCAGAQNLPEIYAAEPTVQSGERSPNPLGNQATPAIRQSVAHSSSLTGQTESRDWRNSGKLANSRSEEHTSELQSHD